MQRRFGSDSPRAGEGEGHREAGSDVGSSSGNGISETRRGGRTREYSAWQRGFRNAWRRGRATSTRWGEGASWSFLSKGNLDPRRSGWKGIFIPFSPIKASRCFEGWTNVRNDTYDVHTYVVGRTCDAHVDATSRIQHQATDGRMEGWMRGCRTSASTTRKVGWNRRMQGAQETPCMSESNVRDAPGKTPRGRPAIHRPRFPAASRAWHPIQTCVAPSSAVLLLLLVASACAFAVHVHVQSSDAWTLVSFVRRRSWNVPIERSLVVGSTTRRTSAALSRRTVPCLRTEDGGQARALIVRSCERAPKPRRAIAVDRTAPPRYTPSADTPANNRTPLAVHLLLLGATDRGQMHLRTPVRSVVFPFRVRVYLDRRGATASRTSHGSNVRHSSAFFVVMWRRLAPRLTSTCGVFEVRKAIERCTNVGTRGLPSNRRETRANGWSSGRATSTTRVVKRTADEGKRAELRHQSRCRSCR